MQVNTKYCSGQTHFKRTNQVSNSNLYDHLINWCINKFILYEFMISAIQCILYTRKLTELHKEYKEVWIDL